MLFFDKSHIRNKEGVLIIIPSLKVKPNIAIQPTATETAATHGT